MCRSWRRREESGAEEEVRRISCGMVPSGGRGGRGGGGAKVGKFGDRRAEVDHEFESGRWRPLSIITGIYGCLGKFLVIQQEGDGSTYVFYK